MSIESSTARGEYSAVHRAMEIVAIVAAAILSLYLVVRLAGGEHPARLWILAGAAVAGYVAADLVSGVVHWIFDTYGSEDTPVLGRGFIRPFREHHDDARAMTRHDFIETNGNNCIASLPVLAATCFVPTDGGLGLATVAFLLFTSLGVLATNQFHKWAHVDDPGRLVRLLQRWHLILPREHHGVHHTAPFATYYCITTGWLNPLLRATDFHRRLEHGITAVARISSRRRGAAAPRSRSA